MSIKRYSTRRARLDESFLIPYLKRAVRYRRIAGYFTSSLFEVAGEQLKHIPDIQIVCNSDIRSEDLKTANVISQRMMGRLNESTVEVDSLINHGRYAMLADFLEQRGQVVRVAANDVCGFLHGKAGIIDLDDGRKIGFIGSMNESKNGWQGHYEILWSDESEEGVRWIEEEFEYLWNAAKPLPEAVVNEIKRRSNRQEVAIDDIANHEQLAPAALIESPLYKEGFALRPWQQGFVGEVIKHYEHYGIVRLLIADEVGLGKTLSMAVSAIVLCLIAEKEKRRRKPIIIFAPSTLCEQWQTELMDKLGVLCARWKTSKKCWVDDNDRAISSDDVKNVIRCPLRIGIISTGLMFQDSEEKSLLTGLSSDGIELAIIDESHKARVSGGLGKKSGEPNELLKFAHAMSEVSRHMIIGTATPIQTKNENLWEQMSILWQGKNGRHVFGNERNPWRDYSKVGDILTGQLNVTDEQHAWSILKYHVPKSNFIQDKDASELYLTLHQEISGAASNPFDMSKTPLHEIDDDTREMLREAIASTNNSLNFFQRENPFVRHVVLRKRKALEDQGLLPKIPVDLHPNASAANSPVEFNKFFEGLALRASDDFTMAYEQATVYGKALKEKGGSGFIINMMRQRVASSIHAGICTAERILHGDELDLEGEDAEIETKDESLLTEDKIALIRMLDYLKSVRKDPKLSAIEYYLKQQRVYVNEVSKTWMEAGCILFSQYYDTAYWMAEQIAKDIPAEPIGLYAGAGKSKLFKDGKVISIDRNHLKTMVKEKQLRLMFATDAACEGLNLQTLGTLINIDLPWNPIKLEQRIGRIQRFGQTREKVDMLNLVNQGTVDEKIYERISERMKDKANIFGGIPDTIKADWIDDIENLGKHMDKFINAQKQATGFDVRYNDSFSPDEKIWSLCSDVLSSQDLNDIMRQKWS